MYDHFQSSLGSIVPSRLVLSLLVPTSSQAVYPMDKVHLHHQVSSKSCVTSCCVASSGVLQELRHFIVVLHHQVSTHLHPCMHAVPLSSILTVMTVT